MERPFSILLMADPKSLTDAELERLIRETGERIRIPPADSMTRSLESVRENATKELRRRGGRERRIER